MPTGSPWLSSLGPAWSKVKRRVVIDAITKQVLSSHSFDQVVNQRSTIMPLPHHSGHVITKYFHHDDQCKSDGSVDESKHWIPTKHQCRQLQSDLKKCNEVLEAQVKIRCKTMVQEVF